MFMPVRALMVAAPPRMSIAVTINDESSPKKRNVKCAEVPHLFIYTIDQRKF